MFDKFRDSLLARRNLPVLIAALTSSGNDSASNGANEGQQEEPATAKENENTATAQAVPATSLGRLARSLQPAIDKKAVSYMMSTDLIESEKDFQVYVDLPGVDPADLEVAIEENKFLTLKAERKHVHEEKSDKVHTMERSFGTVQRKIRLPLHVELEQITTSFKHGVLTIKIPKKVGQEDDSKRKVRKLAINTD
jgi:HSP20 family protein